MDMKDPFMFRGVSYKTVTSMQKAKEAAAIDYIRHKRGIRGWLGYVFMSKEMKKKFGIE